MEAMLIACGELGYRNVTVQDAIDRYGGNRVQFYKLFADKGDCYLAAYTTRTNRLCDQILGAASGGSSWRAGMVAALRELARFATQAPLVARGVLVEVHVARGPALHQREKVFERLSHAIDSARRETESRHSPPPMTAEFMVSAIDAAVSASLRIGEPNAFATEAMPELTWMISAAYFGEGAEGEDRAGLHLW